MHYLIVGGNAAGMSAAARLRKLAPQARVTVLEKSGTVSFGVGGIPYFLAGEFDDVEVMVARPLQAFLDSGVDVRLHHEATGLDAVARQVQVRDTRTGALQGIGYDELLIASGTSPRRPGVPGEDLPCVHTMHSREDALALMARLPGARRVVIIGGGAVGLEAAEAFGLRGCDVTIVQFAPHVFEGVLDAEIATLLEAELQRHQVRLLLNARVDSIIGEGEKFAVVSGEHRLPADLVVLAAGVAPNTQFVAGSGLECDSRGAIVIDDACRTNLPHVYAAGDCATITHRLLGRIWRPGGASANKTGRLAGEVMAGSARTFTATLGSFGVRVFGLEAGGTGLGENAAQAAGFNAAAAFIRDQNHPPYVRTASDVFVKLIYERDSHRILGGQLCGASGGGAVMRVNTLAVAIHAGLTLQELGNMDFVYAPPFAKTWDVLNVAANAAGK